MSPRNLRAWTAGSVCVCVCQICAGSLKGILLPESPSKAGQIQQRQHRGSHRHTPVVVVDTKESLALKGCHRTSLSRWTNNHSPVRGNTTASSSFQHLTRNFASNPDFLKPRCSSRENSRGSYFVCNVAWDLSFQASKMLLKFQVSLKEKKLLMKFFWGQLSAHHVGNHTLLTGV